MTAADDLFDRHFDALLDAFFDHLLDRDLDTHGLGWRRVAGQCFAGAQAAHARCQLRTAQHGEKAAAGDGQTGEEGRGC